MAKFRGNNSAFGSPGIEPRWTHGDKEGIGTAYSAASRIWFTIWNGIVTEVYYPTVDKPQLRDLQLLITDGNTFFHEEKRNLISKVERISPKILGYRVTNADPDGRYQVVKEIVTNPHQPAVMQRVRLSGNKDFLDTLEIFALCAPHLEVGGAGNNGYVVEVAGRQLLVAEKNGRWMALGANIPFSKLSAGYVGQSDGWTDLNFNYKMDWEFDQATDGNIALTGELQLNGKNEFLLGLALGDTEAEGDAQHADEQADEGHISESISHGLHPRLDQPDDRHEDAEKPEPADEQVGEPPPPEKAMTGLV